MTTTAPHRRPSAVARRVGYLIAIAINAVLLYLVNVTPGWREVPFLTPDTARVIGIFNVSLVAAIVANSVFVLVDPPWFKSFGDLITTVISLIAAVRIWQVFPFDFSGSSVNWGLIVRIILAVGIAGSTIGVIVNTIGVVARRQQAIGHD